jgi:hypothetical protein
MLAQPATTKWLIHGYETCGFAKVKRPMLGMLREGLNHHDRIPHDSNGFAVSGWVRHIVAHYHKLPELLLFTKPDTPAESRVFLPQADSIYIYIYIASSSRRPSYDPYAQPEP